MIQSEFQFFWKILKEIAILPYTLLQVIIGKRPASELLAPIKDFIAFLMEPRFSFFMSVILILAYIIFNYMFYIGNIDSTFIMQYLIYKPTDLFEFKFIPFVASWFMHGSITHLASNVLVLMVMGRIVERKLGSTKTMLIFFGAGILSHLFSSIIYIFILNQNTAGIGASGCIMGLVAAAILLDPFYISFETIIPLPIILSGLLYIWSDITGVLLQSQDNIGHFAHIGGFISIPLILYLFGEREKLKNGLMINAAVIVIAISAYFYFGQSFI